jgi:multiple sugar transport system substrate-binding protein
VRQLAALAAAVALSGCMSADTGSEQAGGRTVLTVWHQEQPPHRVAVIQGLLDDFNRSQRDVYVRQQVQNWDSVYQKAPSAIQSGNAPDVLFTIPDFTTVIRQTGAVQPVDDITAALDRKYGFTETALRPYRYDGHTWAVPLYGMVHMLWYRKDLFRQAGLDPNRPPRDWDELLADAKRLTKGDQYGIGVAAGKHLYTDQLFYTFMIANGAKDLFAPDGRLNFDNPRTVETLAFYKRLAGMSPKGINSWSWAEPQAQFNAGTLAMAIEKGQFIGPFAEESGRPPEDLGVAPMPHTPNGERGSIYYSNGVMVLTRDPSKRRAALRFLDFMLEPRTYAKFLLSEPGLYLPVTRTGDSPAWRDSKILAPYGGALDAMLEESRHGQLFGFTTENVNPGIGPISAQNMLAQVVQEAVVADEEPRTAVERGQEEMQETLDR